MTLNVGRQQQSLGDAAYCRDLGAGLALRWATAADLDGLVALYGGVVSPGPDKPPDTHIQTHVADLMSGRHPLIALTDFSLVRDTVSGGVVAAACLMAQTWRYEGIALPVGRPEIVATAPEYRNRGLMRAVFDLLHARSAARGDLALGITGIYHYFRTLGYEYALDLSRGPAIAVSALPALPRDAAEPYTLRLVTVADIPRLIALHERESKRVAVSTTIDAAYWRWQLDGMEAAMERWAVHATTPGLSRPRRAARHLPRRAARHLPRRVDRRRYNRHRPARPIPGAALVGAIPRLAVQQR